jgi:hypothetical protein
MMDKKGVIEVQFNWIFIMIVGAIILLFFISIVVQQHKASEKKIAFDISSDMASIFSGAQISVNTEHSVEIPPLDIFFECDEQTLYSAYRIKDSELPLGESLIIFSPSYILGNGRNIITWSVDWNVPYRVMNFLYLTTDRARYIFLNDTQGYGQELYDSVPDFLSKDIYHNVDQIDDKNNYKVRLITFDDVLSSFPGLVVPTNLQFMKDTDLSMIHIEPIASVGQESKISGKSNITYYIKNGTEFLRVGTTQAIGKASVYGAIYSENIENYNCNMKKAYLRLRLLTEIYHDRVEKLKGYYRQNPDPQNCEAKLDDVLYDLENIAGRGFTQSGVDGHYSDMVSIKQKNKQIQRYSCPVVY